MSDMIESPVGQRLKSWHGEEWHTKKGSIIRDIVYSMDTGLVTTVSFLAGASASLDSRPRIITACLVQIMSGAIAIFFGSYISTKAQKTFFKNQIEREKREIEEDPEKEKAEIREIFGDMGFTKEEQETAVKRITPDKDRWLKFMVQEEIGINPGFIDNPFEIGSVSAGSFLIGVVPAILPFLLMNSVRGALAVSAGSVLTFLFILGVMKTRITKAHWLLSGVETLVFGAMSCGAGFFLGRMIAKFM